MPSNEENPKHHFKRLLPTDYFGIQNFMVSEGGMGLSGSNLMVFALVYSYSHNHDASDYYGSADYASARLGISRASVQAAFKSLLERGLVCVKGERKSKKGKPMKVYSVAEDAVDRAIAEFETYWSADGIAYQPNYLRARPQDIVVENPASDNVQKLDIIEDQQENGLDNVQKLDVCLCDNVQKLDIIKKGLDFKEDSKTNQPTSPSGSCPSEQPQATTAQSAGRLDSFSVSRGEFEALVAASKNRNRLKFAEAAYLALLSEGYSANDISRAWKKRCSAAVGGDWEPNYHPQLTTFLEAEESDPNGARSTIASLHEADAKRGRIHAIQSEQQSQEAVKRLRFADSKYDQIEEDVFKAGVALGILASTGAASDAINDAQAALEAAQAEKKNYLVRIANTPQHPHREIASVCLGMQSNLEKKGVRP